MHDTFEMLVQNLFRLFRVVSESEKSREETSTRGGWYWSLMTKAFELWFPTWAIQELGSSGAAGEAGSLISKAPLNAASAVATAIRSDTEASTQSIREACEAESFVFSIFSHFYKYRTDIEDDSWAHLHKVTMDLVQHPSHPNREAFFAVPGPIDARSYRT